MYAMSNRVRPGPTGCAGLPAGTVAQAGPSMFVGCQDIYRRSLKGFCQSWLFSAKSEHATSEVLT